MTRACGFVIFRLNQKIVEYLLMQTSYGSFHWTPPKGHVDKGESDMETAIRETEEEAGLKGSDLKIYEDAKIEINYLVKKKPKAVVYWLAELVNENKSVTMSHEHKDYKWLPLAEACNLAQYEEMKKVLNFMDEYISKNLTQRL